MGALEADPRPPGHGEAVSFVKSFGIPLLVLGGGGYTIRNVARCWAYETALLLNQTIADTIPHNDYLEYFGPDYRLHLQPAVMENRNSAEYLLNTVKTITDNLRELTGAPSVQFQEVRRAGAPPLCFDAPLCRRCPRMRSRMRWTRTR